MPERPEPSSIWCDHIRHIIGVPREPEVRAWTVQDSTRAVDAAGAIHTDLSRGFIRAEVVAYDDYIRDGGIAGAKEKGHFRLEGKDYRVQDGDIILFRFNV